MNDSDSALKKRLAVLYLLQILRTETDAAHRMTQKQLMERLWERFEVRLNRRTLKQHLTDLMDAGYPLNYTETSRTAQDGTAEPLLTDWYLEPDFESSELQLLIDLLSELSTLPDSQRSALQQKLAMLAPIDARKKAAHIQPVSAHYPAAPQLLYSVELLTEAIERRCMVEFSYGSYRLNAKNKPKLRPRTMENGTERSYIASPYEILVSHGRYYLLCCKSPYRSLASYRIDRMMDLHLIPELPRLPLSSVEGVRRGKIDVPKHLAEHLYLYSGETVECVFLADGCILNDIVDWFGLDAKIEPVEYSDRLTVTVQVHPTAMHHWALQYGDYVEVLSPPEIRNQIAATVQKLSQQYLAENQ